MQKITALLKSPKTRRATAQAAPALNQNDARQRIAERAYGIYQERGQQHGHDLDDWLEAERVILSEIGE